MSLQYGDSPEELNAIEEQYLRLIQTSDGGATWQLLNSSLDVNTNTLTISGVNNLTGFTAGKLIGTLPVELISFKAARKGTDAVLAWVTATEENCLGYEIEAANGNATEFVKVGFVSSKNGNSTEKQSYTFTDKTTRKAGTVYYRLKQTDTDGNYSYYGPVAVTFDVVTAVETWPNPFAEELQVELTAVTAGQASITLYNSAGAVVFKSAYPLVKGKNQLKLQELRNLPSGMYMLTTEVDGELKQTKLLKQ
ncbi:MAG: T9SS type A sorting domain-containing protein, partial [Hymenobacteraceae bacterium]|nr:T9SS type A sorting domain-containing protein [Hymenobacteraceae bacterium]